MIRLPDNCLNDEVEGCRPLAQIQSDDRSSFICCGENGEAPDPFTVCWHNCEVDERGHWDRRDIVDTISVLAQALSVITNEEEIDG